MMEGKDLPPPTMETENTTREDDTVEKKIRQRRWHYQIGLLFFTSLYTTFMAGAFFGWGPMQILLTNDGAFYHPEDCNSRVEEEDILNNNASLCREQTRSLLNVHSVASLTMIFTPFMGHIADTKGPLVLLTVVATLGCLGCTLAILSRVFEVDWLLYIGFSCIATMAFGTSVMITETGVVAFAATGTAAQRRVITVFNNLFDAGSITYLGLWKIQDVFPQSTTLELLLTGYLAFAAVAFGGSLLFWKLLLRLPLSSPSLQESLPKDCEEPPILVPPNKMEENEPPNTQPPIEVGVEDCRVKQEIECTHEKDTTTTTTTTTTQTQILDPADTTLYTDTIQTSAANENDDDDTQRLANQKTNNDTTTDNNNTIIAETTTTTNEKSPSKEKEEDYILISLRSPVHQLRSTQFILLILFFSFHVSRNIFTLTTAKSFLSYLGDDDANNKYITIFTLMMPASILGFPLVDYALHTFGYGMGLQLINGLAIVHGTIQVSTPNLNVQILGFVVFSFYRSCLFSIVFAFVPTFMGRNVLGKANGIMQVFGAVTCLLNIPLSNSAVQYWDGNFFIPNLLYTLLVGITILAAYHMGKGIQIEDHCRTTSRSLLSSLS